MKKARSIPKNLVRGASKDPKLYDEALKVVKLREKEAKLKNKKRKAPKAMDIDAGAGTRLRAAEQRKHAHKAREDIFKKHRAMDLDDEPKDEPKKEKKKKKSKPPTQQEKITKQK